MFEVAHSRQIGNDRERSGSHPGAGHQSDAPNASHPCRAQPLARAGLCYRFSRVDEALGKGGMIPAAAKAANRLIQANQHYLGSASAPGIPPNLVTVSSIHWR
jgi:hypothetical protein